MRALALAFLVALACTCGCGAYELRNTLAPLAIDLRHGATRESFMDLLRIARAENYLIEFSDPEFGVFGARSRFTPPRGQPDLVFVVQCYADGHATLTVVGGSAIEGGRVRVSDRVRREAVALAQALDAQALR